MEPEKGQKKPTLDPYTVKLLSPVMRSARRLACAWQSETGVWPSKRRLRRLIARGRR